MTCLMNTLLKFIGSFYESFTVPKVICALEVSCSGDISINGEVSSEVELALSTII
ncbi:protein of unknown function [Maridesulfovibrio hydrothermalis AM13 = DSM 14728]|uniref:Uncharacterized protein n=1 Tax=Maridesulfovibrio hydrothermalis AM13 = DSM 14728 TaxID=1121451 RepID=L0R9D8_9BACT|nr:protein of unknown function [Maridesulfovibrio hydrothermalis AM13 = DSM 14728]